MSTGVGRKESVGLNPMCLLLCWEVYTLKIQYVFFIHRGAKCKPAILCGGQPKTNKPPIILVYFMRN